MNVLGDKHFETPTTVYFMQSLFEGKNADTL